MPTADRETRMADLLTRLRDEEDVCEEEYAYNYQISRATMYRDIAALKSRLEAEGYTWAEERYTYLRIDAEVDDMAQEDESTEEDAE